MFPQLDNALNITLTIIVSLTLAWVAFLIIDLLFFFFFKTILNKHSKGMTLILNTKYENTKKLFALMQKYEIQIDDKLLKTLDSVNPQYFKSHDSKEAEETRNLLSYLKDEASFIANKNKEVLDKPDFQLAKSNVIELDAQYRSNIAMYNADVLGYNYWVSFLPCRFVFKIFKVKKKKIIG